MKSNSDKNDGKGKPDPSLIADLAVMPKNVFIQMHNCTEEEYYRAIQEFGIERIISFLWNLTKGICTGEVKVEPIGIKGQVIEVYKMRIVILSLFDYEKSDFVICEHLAYC